MKHLISILLLSFSISAISQNVTIDYQTWNPSGTTCSLFVSATNVPATGTTSGTIEHQRKLGETRYINSDLSIQIKTEYQTTGAVYKGGRYRIAYNFKSGYTYTIYVTAAAVENTIGYPTGPFIRLDINNNGGGGSTGCNGPEILNYNAGGNPAAVKLSSNSFQEFQFVFPQMGTQPTLEITAFPETNGGTKTVRIRKIRIVETPPAATFTLSPSSPSIQCGSTTAQTFTVTNVNNTPNVTNHTWNLGTNNGWLYNGNPAPQTISTGTTNSLTLAPICGAAQKNISVTVSAGGNNYNTNTSTVSVIPPAMSITGNTTLCSGSSVYTVNNVPCNASVTWSASPSSGIISLSPNGNSVTVTKTGNGRVGLSAKINACNNYTVSKDILVGGPTQAYGGIQPVTYYPDYCSGQTYYFELLGATGDADQYEWIAYGPTQTSYYFTYSDQSVPITFSEAGTYEIVVVGTNTCGSAVIATTFIEVASCGWGFAVSPNPGVSNIKITPNMNTATKVNAKPLEVREVEIIDKMGVIKYRQKFGKGLTTVNISVSQLPNDIYTLRIFDGKKWHSHKIVVQH